MQDVCDLSPGTLLCPALQNVVSKKHVAWELQMRRWERKEKNHKAELGGSLVLCKAARTDTVRRPLLPNQGTVPSGIRWRPALLLTTPLPLQHSVKFMGIAQKP